MRWVVYFLLSLPVAGVGLVGGGVVGAACLRWHGRARGSGQDGGGMLWTALAGGMVGLLAGLGVLGWMAPVDAAGRVGAVGLCVGVLWVLTLVLLGVAWWLADIEPTLEGRPLELQVELRLPSTVEPMPDAATGRMRFHSEAWGRGRRTVEGRLLAGTFRRESGRWVVRGETELFTRRGKRVVEMGWDGGVVEELGLPVPARPGREHLEWSDWLPVDVEKGERGMQYRYRVQRVE